MTAPLGAPTVGGSGCRIAYHIALNLLGSHHSSLGTDWEWSNASRRLRGGSNYIKEFILASADGRGKPGDKLMFRLKTKEPPSYS